MATDPTKLYVLHIGTEPVMAGTKSECESYKNGKDYNTSSWKICTLEEFGNFCYTEGYDSGYDAGYGACDELVD